MRHVKELAGKYICFSNVHTSVMAREDAAYRDVLNGAAFVFPDGNPIAVLQQKEGYVGAKRVAGPDFMERMFNDTADGRLSHFFYGSTQETLDALKAALFEKYPGLDVRGMYSPPFRELTPEEDQADIDMINASGADIVWIGLGAPKQEKWMKAHEGKINGVMMGVGAGFNFHAGNIKRAPVWIQKIGFEWLYRLFQDPKRLFKRYFVTNVKFFWYLMLSWIKAGHQA
jgi:exopolysaccharide biosynthesis WecB/TagA/CpsF family protein